MKNWRPITLLNTAYKIASSCIAERIKTVLPNIINEDQKGFMKGRYIGENIRLLYDTMLYTKEHDLNGLLLSVDFEKAFDSIAWSFIHKALDKFNFGEDIKRWISTFYQNISSCVSVNGQYSSWFSVKRGTRQGDPLSPYLFLICAEIMACMIRSNDEIKGISVDDLKILLSQFADDTTIFLDGRKESFNACISTLKLFASMSGLKLNYDKSVAVWIGRSRNSNVKFMPELGLIWNPSTFKFLGIIFSVNIETMVNFNYASKLEQIRNMLKQWSKRNLTPFGKITVLKTLVLSKLTYLFINLPDPSETFLNDLQKLMFNFLWDGKPDKIKRTCTFQTYEEGGLKMIDVKSFLCALKCTWMKRGCIENEKLFKMLVSMCPLFTKIKHRGGEFVNILMQRCVNPFWVDVLKHYKKLNDICVPMSADDFACECLYYNVNIQRGKKVVYIREWDENDIKTVGDLIGSNGFLTFLEFQRKYPNVTSDFLLYEGIVKSAKEYAKRLDIKEIEVNENVLHDMPIVWKQLSKGSSKLLYFCFVKRSIPLKCIDKWSEAHNKEYDVKKVFTHVIKTTSDTRLRWFQYKIIHRILPTQRFLFLRKIVTTPLCCLCNVEEETFEHLFWECERIQFFWEELTTWFHENFVHCSHVFFSKELVIMGVKPEVKTDKSFDLIMLLAKHYIFSCKLKKSAPLLRVFLQILKQRYMIEKVNAYTNGRQGFFHQQWRLYSHFFSS